MPILDNDNDWQPPKQILASKNDRILNLLIDTFAISAIYITMAQYFYGDMEMGTDDFESNPNLWRIMVLEMTIRLFYYVSFEFFGGGKTLGKIFTHTVVLTNEFQKPDLQTIMLRTLIRLVPFEAISFLIGTTGGWHDAFSRTVVVKQNK